MTGVRAGVLLVFRVDQREFALPVDCVVEVVRMVAPTPLPDAPPWVLGVLDYRGVVIPLIDVRARLGATPRAPDLATPIVVIGDGAEPAAGLLVDEVVEVVAIAGEAARPPADVLAQAPAVAAVAQHGEHLVLVLDLDQIVDHSGDLLGLELAGAGPG